MLVLTAKGEVSPEVLLLFAIWCELGELFIAAAFL